MQRSGRAMQMWCAASTVAVCGCTGVYDYHVARSSGTADASTDVAPGTRTNDSRTHEPTAVDAGAKQTEPSSGWVGTAETASVSDAAVDAAARSATPPSTGEAIEHEAEAGQFDSGVDKDAGEVTIPSGARADSGTTAVVDKGIPCPRAPTEGDESFCYDFESGVNGPRDGEVYDLWTTPEVTPANQLSVVGLPANSQNHVLQTLPSLAATEASAAVSHSTRQFDMATVEFDFWANDALVQVSEEVSWFRYVPVDGNYEHVVSLVFRRGQAQLRSEDGRTTSALSRLPQTNGMPTHIKVQLDRRSPCHTEVWMDDDLVAGADESECSMGRIGFVEFGLVMLDSSSDRVTAYYDNVSLTRQ